MIFVDTSAWFASAVPSDADHAAASRWLAQNTYPLFTTDYIVDETLTLLKVRGQALRAMALGEEFFQGNRAVLHFLTGDEIREAWEVFRKFKDKEWSFTDCTSKVVMEKSGMTTAFAFDHHFHQFGTAIVVP